MPSRLEFELQEDDVDVTNLIDLLVVLCALLMLLMPAITSFREIHGLAISEGQGTPGMSSLSESPIIKFSADGNCLWNDAPITLSDLAHRKPETAAATIYLAGEPEASYGLSIELRTLLREAGWDVRELTQPKRKGTQ